MTEFEDDQSPNYLKKSDGLHEQNTRNVFALSFGVNDFFFLDDFRKIGSRRHSKTLSYLVALGLISCQFHFAGFRWRPRDLAKHGTSIKSFNDFSTTLSQSTQEVSWSLSLQHHVVEERCNQGCSYSSTRNLCLSKL